MTKLVRSVYNIKPDQRGGVVTIGNFDGVHIGHQQLIKHTVSYAKEKKIPSTAITFEPHAFEYFSQHEVTIPRLTRLREKYIHLASLGLDYVLIIPFNQWLAQLSASEFVYEILYKGLQTKHIIIGDDFHFGRNRQGDFALLKEMGGTLGFTVETLPTVTFAEERVSSTRVRKALAHGDIALVQQLLGRPYTMMGRVRRGDQRGRQLGFPTANIFLHRKLTPVKGVYTVYMRGLSADPKKAFPGVANIGQRPTVNGSRTLLEVHLLDFNQDIYGQYVAVEFCKKVRDEVRFPNLDLLKEQIASDVQFAKTYFEHGE